MKLVPVLCWSMIGPIYTALTKYKREQLEASELQHTCDSALHLVLWGPSNN